MTFTELNGKLREYLFFLLALSIPLSAAGISISIAFIFILLILEGNLKQKLKHILSQKYYIAIFVYFLLHLIGQVWIEVEPVNSFKSWMIFLIPFLAISVKPEVAIKALLVFLYAMMIAEAGVYYNIFIFWDTYAISPGIYNKIFWTISHITYTPFLALTISIALTMMMSNQIYGWRKYLTSFFIITMIVNLFLLGGRAGQLVFLFVWILLALYFFRKNFKGLILMLLSVTLIYLIAWNYSPMFKDRVVKAVTEVEQYINNRIEDNQLVKTSVGVRLNFMENGIRLFSEKPFLGHGTGSYENAIKKFSENSDYLVFTTTNPHNSHILILVQFGILGALIYLNIFYRQFMEFKDTSQKYVYRPLMIVMPLFFLFISFYDSYLWGHHSQALFVFLSSIIYRKDVIKLLS